MNRLYYFTGTGNSLYLAQRLSDEIGECELVSIASALQQESIFDASDRIGIIFPVYCFGQPLIINEFLAKLKISPESYLFGCCSYGGLLGGAMELFQAECSRNGLAMKAGFAVNMPGNAIFVYDRIAEPKQQKMAERLERRIPKIAEQIRQKRAKKPERFPFPFNKMLSSLYPKMIVGVREGAKQFQVTGKCTHCKECEDLCPVGNISFSGNSVIWGEKCEQCMACIQLCPEAAIEKGEKTAGHQRYRHRCITAEQIKQQGK